jgi:hypothetical protein
MRRGHRSELLRPRAKTGFRGWPKQPGAVAQLLATQQSGFLGLVFGFRDSSAVPGSL